MLTILAKFYTKISTTLLFWLAFVLTRPLGATVGDLLTKSHSKGGLGFGTIGVSAVLLVILMGFILFTTYQRHEIHTQKNAQTKQPNPF